jgi:DNA mismatch repair protein MutS
MSGFEPVAATDEKQEKPMYRKYFDVWSSYAATYGPKTALLYQVGGFFEIYDTENLTTGTSKANVREIAELCQLSLSQHPLGADSQTLFGGFPEHALGKFEKILVTAGWTVVVVVQKKGATGVVEDRVVDHISSPGCYLDSGIKERRLVGCVIESMSDGPSSLRRVYWAISALDLATGRIWYAEGAGAGTPDRLHQFLCLNPPSELVIWSDGLPAAASLTDSLKNAFSSSAVHLRCLGVASVAIEEAILRKFWTKNQSQSHSVTQPQGRRALSLLMDFAGDHMPSALKSLQEPELWIPEGEVRLGNAALEQLGLVSLRSSSGQEGKQSLLGLMDKCRSVAGRRLMRSRLLRPISVIPELEARLDRIDQVVKRDAVMTERGLRGLYDISRLWRRLELGSASMNDMACFLRSLDSASSLGYSDSVGSAFLTWIGSVWSADATATIAREEGVTPVRSLPFVTGSMPEIEALFQEGLAIRAEAETLCDTWSSCRSSSSSSTKPSKASKASKLEKPENQEKPEKPEKPEKTEKQEKQERLYIDDADGGGFRITGTKRRVNAVLTLLRDEGDKSATVTPYKSTSMIETAGLEAISTRHRAWMRRWVPAWSSCWSSALALIVEKGRKAVPAIEAWCADLDLSWTVAGLAREWLWKRPVFVEAAESFVEAAHLRHPILERIQLGGSPYVSHSVALTPHAISIPDTVKSRQGLLLYGMNASGKSSLMKAIGISCLLAQAGFPVPAASFRLSPFTAIFTRILGNDNLWAGLSSFAVEMTEFREILRFADARSLVLGDELCSGTESLSATALVAAGVEHLASIGTKFVFATHLHELASLPDIASLSSVKAVHLKVEYDSVSDRLIYDRRLAPGSGSALYGLEVCRALDLPLGYLDRATALRKTLAGWTAPTVSSYSSAVVVDACAVCQGTTKLEVHHIRPQADAVKAEAEGFDLNAAGNLVCLCATCHDDHHAARLIIQGWQETSAGRLLVWSRLQSTSGLTEDVKAWIREQRLLKIRVPTIQRMAKQIFDVELSVTDIKTLK